MRDHGRFVTVSCLFLDTMKISVGFRNDRSSLLGVLACCCSRSRVCSRAACKCVCTLVCARVSLSVAAPVDAELASSVFSVLCCLSAWARFVRDRLSLSPLVNTVIELDREFVA